MTESTRGLPWSDRLKRIRERVERKLEEQRHILARKSIKLFQLKQECPDDPTKIYPAKVEEEEERNALDILQKRRDNLDKANK